MKLISNYLLLTTFLFVKTTGEETTTDKVTETTESHPEPLTPKIDLKDFKVTKLKGHHFEDDQTKDCLANLDPLKVEAVKKSIRNHDGKYEYIPADPSHVSDDDIKIANCLKQEATEKITQAKTKETLDNATNPNSDDNKINLNKEVDKDVETEKETVQRRRDTEYKFETLDYYDEQMQFDNTTCPDKVDVIELQLSEVKRYDLECERITYWIGLAEVETMSMSYK